MIVCGEKKRPGGKLVKVCLNVEDGIVKGVLITGDFFVDPGEEFEKIIERLERIEVPIEYIEEEIRNAFMELNDRIFGIGIEEIIEATRKALNELNK
ncbi:hypothetical protein PNA2_1447 [Pyrococcus sp. NA2]|uniref:lipoate protein ligase C-terminal domain-containing protein n=1 Tax=Pyrococcus sp. (strain NA2) TaxID=342949 RepID=UPI000209AF86|nr:lipoate protein ligase C-terminal domain-containing protein [Pyrococcus sp. NA2]AEC52362.1 hypothetical protein PNA2_1447 [Pyrococcus sp. NA2]